MRSGHVAGHVRIGADDEVRLVLRLQAAHVEQVAARLDVRQAMAREVRRRVAFQQRGAVGDERRLAAVALAVVVGDDLSVGHDHVGEDEREPLAERVPEPAGQAPLGALSLDAVHVEGHLGPAQSGQEGEERIGGIDEQDGVVLVKDSVQGAYRRVRHGLQVLAAQPGHETSAHARRQRPRLVGAAAIRVDGDLMTARRQLAGELPGHRLEAAIGGRDATAAEDGDTHPGRVPRAGSPNGECTRTHHMAQDDPVQIAYLVHFRGGSESGILRKVASQAAAWSDLGAKVGLFVATSPESAAAWRALPETVEVRTPPTGPLARPRERESLVRDVERWRPDVVYLRHGLVHPGLIRLARRFPCVVEINGDDLAEFRLTSTRRYLLARATRGSLLRRAAGLVFVTHELAAMPSFAAYGRPSIVIGNGIDLSSVEAAPPVHNEQPRLVFIGHPDTPWHGLDHVAEIAAAFPKWQLDLIGPRDGELPAAGSIANLVAHGPLDPDAYRPFIEASDVAIGTLGLYRKHMDEASPLKVREYLAAGLPVDCRLPRHRLPGRGALHPSDPERARWHTRLGGVDSHVRRRVARSPRAAGTRGASRCRRQGRRSPPLPGVRRPWLSEPWPHSL